MKNCYNRLKNSLGPKTKKSSDRHSSNLSFSIETNFSRDYCSLFCDIKLESFDISPWRNYDSVSARFLRYRLDPDYKVAVKNECSNKHMFYVTDITFISVDSTGNSHKACTPHENHKQKLLIKKSPDLNAAVHWHRGAPFIVRSKIE